MKQEAAILWVLGLLSTVLISLAGFMISLSNDLKFKGIWVLFAGLVSTSLLLCLFFQSYLVEDVQTKGEPKVEAISPIKPEKLEEPTFREKVDKVTISFGTNIFFYSYSDLQKSPVVLPILTKFLGKENQITIFVKDNKPYLNLKIYGGNEFQSIEIINNEFTKPANWDSNSNQEALEIVDVNKAPVFQLFYKTSSHIVVNCIFKTAQGSIIIVDENGTKINPPVTSAIALSRRIFKYPAWQYPGQFQ